MGPSLEQIPSGEITRTAEDARLGARRDQPARPFSRDPAPPLPLGGEWPRLRFGRNTASATRAMTPHTMAASAMLKTYSASPRHGFDEPRRRRNDASMTLPIAPPTTAGATAVSRFPPAHPAQQEGGDRRGQQRQRAVPAPSPTTGLKVTPRFHTMVSPAEAGEQPDLADLRQAGDFEHPPFAHLVGDQDGGCDGRPRRRLCCPVSKGVGDPAVISRCPPPRRCRRC
jgi:hypothetical protein